MVKYLLNTSQKYTLPAAIKKYNDRIKLRETEAEKEETENKLKKLRAKYKEGDIWSEDDKIEKEELLSKLTKAKNAIYEINAELNNSTVNFNNANIKELNTKISDISSLINNNKFNSMIGQQISELLTSQIELNNIFESPNFKNLLEDIAKKVKEKQKDNKNDNNIKEVGNKINEKIEDINNNPERTPNENYEDWKDMRDDIKNVIPEDLRIIIKKYGDNIKKINELKAMLFKTIFKRDIGSVSDEELEEYSYKFLLLSNLYDLVEKNLKGKYFNVVDSGNLTGLNTGFTNDDIYKIISNLRKWFSEGEYEPFNENTLNQILVPNISNNKLFNAAFVNDIDPVDIREAIDLINNNIKRMKDNENKTKQYQQKSLFANEDEYQKLEKKREEKKKKKENKNKNNVNNIDNNNDNNNENSAGLDLDEIHQLNVMNSIIKSLNDINETLKGIKESLSKQNFKVLNSQKLGRFKVEKYNPNMSITEFKKLFNKED